MAKSVHLLPGYDNRHFIKEVYICLSLAHILFADAIKVINLT